MYSLMCSALFVVDAGARSTQGTKIQQKHKSKCLLLEEFVSQQKTWIFKWKMRRGKLHISCKIIVVHFPASLSQEHPAGSVIFALRSDIQGEGHTAQVAVSGWIINDTLPVQFALYLDVSVVLHSCKTHGHHRCRVVYLWQKRRKGLRHQSELS